MHIDVVYFKIVDEIPLKISSTFLFKSTPFRFKHDDNRRKIVCPTDDIFLLSSPTLVQDGRPFSHIFICIYIPPRAEQSKMKR